MNKVNKGGKLPLSVKEASLASDFSPEDLDINMLKLDKELINELDEKKLVHRWINLKEYKEKGNFHKSGWRPYKTDQKSEVGSLDFNYGVSPEGYYIRGDLILAVKTTEMNERWKHKLRLKKDAQTGKNYAQELREKFKSHGLAAKVHDGYEENGKDDE